MTAYGDILWTPSQQRVDASPMGRFAAVCSARYGLDLRPFAALHAWSVAEPALFWQELAAFVGVTFTAPATSVYEPPPPAKMRGARWFSGAKLNYAEHLLAGPERAEAVVAVAEGAPLRTFSVGELRREVARCAAALRRCGVVPGDRVAGVVGNLPEALIAMLATTALGGVWSSCSPDFGAAAVSDRLRQIEPKVVFFTASYVYNGRRFDCLPQITAVLAQLSSQGVVIDHLHTGAALPAPLVNWEKFVQEAPAEELSFVPRDFSDPLFILFSSGTTGVPKAIVHSVGGTLLQHKKELLLHSDIGPDSRLLFYTTCGWMMWNWMVSALSTGASLVLFEGSVASPDLGVLWRTAREHGVTALGTSPKFIATCMSQDLDARAALAGHKLRTVLATGAPLLPEHFAWLYEHGSVDGDLHVASISGGTDIISCFMLGTPTLPVRAGEIQYAGLGMKLAAWELSGEAVLGKKAELVCTLPFPAMPLGFWQDQDGSRYASAYFEHFAPPLPEVWRHGDFIEIRPHGGIVVYGRSDATLNPGGVRIGTAELYRQVETIAGILDAVAVARREGGDERIVLFVKLAAGQNLDAALLQTIKTTIRKTLTPRHIPSEILQVSDIPYTRSGKKVELAVTQAIHNEPVSNYAALANPEVMEEFCRIGRAWAAL